MGILDYLTDVIQWDYKHSADVLAKYGNWQRPSEDLARKWHQHHHSHHQMFDVYATPTRDLKEFGQGHLLYFYFLKYAAWLFAVLSVLPSLVLFIVYCGGGYLDTGDLQYTTLGNFGLISFSGHASAMALQLPGTGRGADAEAAVANVFAVDASNPPASLFRNWNKRSTIIALSVLDLMGCLLYFGASLWFMWFTKAAARRARDAIITVEDYTVRIDNLPKGVSSDEIGSFCSRYGDVMAVELCHTCDTLVQQVRERQEATEKLDLANAVIQRHAEVYPKTVSHEDQEDFGLDSHVAAQLEVVLLKHKYDVALLHEEVREKQRELGSRPVVTAFVTYKDDEVKQVCLDSQRTAWQRLLVALGLRPPVPPEECFRLGHVPDPKFSRAPAPTDVLFENLEFIGWRRFWRRLLAFVLKYGALLLGFVLVNLAPALRKNLNSISGGPATSTCLTSCKYLSTNGNFNITSTQRVEFKSCHTTGAYTSKLACEAGLICYECFCKTALNRGVYSEGAYCREFAYVLLLTMFSQMVAVMAIVSVNFLILKCIQRVTRIERHHTRSQESHATIRGLFWSQFLNTAISTLIANAYLPGLTAKLQATSLHNIIFTGVFTDTTPNWYSDVGRPLMLAMLVGLLMRMACIYYDILYHQIRVRWRHQSLTQQELQAALEGHEFTLDTRYGEHLAVVYITLMYSSAMPVLNWLAAISFALHYWVEKHELLRVCQRPITYSADLAVYVASALPFAALWHLGFALWSFSFYATPRSAIAPVFLHSWVLGLMHAVGRVWDETTQQSPKRIADRLLQSNSAHFFYFLLICGAALFLIFTIAAWARLIRRGLHLLGLVKPVAILPEDLPAYPIAVRTQLLIGETTYNILDLPAYQEAFERLDDYDHGVPLSRRVLNEAAALNSPKLSEALRLRLKRSRQNKIQPETPSLY